MRVNRRAALKRHRTLGFQEPHLLRTSARSVGAPAEPVFAVKARTPTHLDPASPRGWRDGLWTRRRGDWPPFGTLRAVSQVERPQLSVTGLGGHWGPPLPYGGGRSRKFAPNFRYTLEQLFIQAYFFVAPGPADVCYMDSGDEARSMAVGDKNHLVGRKE